MTANPSSSSQQPLSHGQRDGKNNNKHPQTWRCLTVLLQPSLDASYQPVVPAPYPPSCPIVTPEKLASLLYPRWRHLREQMSLCAKDVVGLPRTGSLDQCHTPVITENSSGLKTTVTNMPSKCNATTNLQLIVQFIAMFFPIYAINSK